MKRFISIVSNLGILSSMLLLIGAAGNAHAFTLILDADNSYMVTVENGLTLARPGGSGEPGTSGPLVIDGGTLSFTDPNPTPIDNSFTDLTRWGENTYFDAREDIVNNGWPLLLKATASGNEYTVFLTYWNREGGTGEKISIGTPPAGSNTPGAALELTLVGEEPASAQVPMLPLAFVFGMIGGLFLVSTLVQRRS